MEEGMIPAAPRKAFCPPDNCPSSQQCPRCRINNRRLPRPVLPPATPWISTSPKAPRLQYQPRLYPLNPPPIITANPIKSVPARVRGNTHSVRCKQHPHRSPASWASRTKATMPWLCKFKLLYSLQSHATLLFKIWIKCNKMSPISGG